MASGIYAALSGAIASEARVDILSHNLANAHTAGFQGFRTVMETARGAVKNEELTYATVPEAVTDKSPGPIVNTTDPLDLALFTGVYMGVESGGEQGYIRGATLLPMEDGRVLTTEGHVVMDENGAELVVPANVRDLRVQSDGTVLADGNEVGRLRLVEFENEDGLVQDQGRFIVDGGNANPIAATANRPVMPGYLEMANISAVKSMTDLISAQHSYSASVKVIESMQAMEKKAAEGLIG